MMRQGTALGLVAALLAGCAASPAADGGKASQRGGGRCSSALEAALEELQGDLGSFERGDGAAGRTLALQGCYAEAARLIDAYLERVTELPAMEKALPTMAKARLEFHAGQMYAVAGDSRVATARLEAARVDDETPEAMVRWNAYVEATLAFLRGDRAMLERQRKIIAAGPEVAGEIPHLRMVDVLVHHFGEPYRVAYESIRPKLRNRGRMEAGGTAGRPGDGYKGPERIR